MLTCGEKLLAPRPTPQSCQLFTTAYYVNLNKIQNIRVYALYYSYYVLAGFISTAILFS